MIFVHPSLLSLKALPLTIPTQYMCKGPSFQTFSKLHHPCVFLVTWRLGAQHDVFQVCPCGCGQLSCVHFCSFSSERLAPLPPSCLLCCCFREFCFYMCSGSSRDSLNCLIYVLSHGRPSGALHFFLRFRASIWNDCVGLKICLLCYTESYCNELFQDFKRSSLFSLHF